MKLLARTKRPMLLLLISTLILSGCESLTPSSAMTEALGHAGFCDVAKPIGWSARDTDKTIIEVKSHNARGVELCGWGKK